MSAGRLHQCGRNGQSGLRLIGQQLDSISFPIRDASPADRRLRFRRYEPGQPEDVQPQAVLRQLLESTAVEQFEVAVPTLDEIFIRTVRPGRTPQIS